MESRGRRRLLGELCALGVLTLGAYGALWWAQNALWSNGLTADMTPVLPREADTGAGISQAVLVIALGVVVTALAAWLFGRAGRFAEAGLGWAMLAIPAVVAVALYALPPTLSIDAYSYLSHGFLAATPGSNPYVDASSSVMATPFGGELLRNGWQPVHPVTPYGPLWTAIECGAFVLSGGSVPVGILLIKLPTFLAVLGTAFLVFRLVGELMPERRFTATLLFLGNPLVLIELVGDGHNDAVMIFFVVLAIYATVRRWGFVAVTSLAFAALVKPSALPIGLLVPVALVWWRRSLGRVVAEIAAGVVVSAGAAVALFAPYWVGWHTLDGLLDESLPGPGLSVSGILSSLLGPTHAQAALSVLLVLVTVAACFLMRTTIGFLRACVIVALAIFVLLPLEWPWYAALPAALLAIEADELDAVVILVLALGSRLVAPIGDASAIGAMSYTLFTTIQALVGQAIPGVIALWATVSRAVSSAVGRAPGPLRG